MSDQYDDSELTMRDMATGTLLGMVSPASGGRRIARSAITNETAEFTDYWTACQWLREKYPIAPVKWPTGFAHHHFGHASQVQDRTPE